MILRESCPTVDIRPADVLVPEFYWKCSAFLCQPDDDGERIPKGTAFFVAAPVGTTEVLYAVTAGHNVQFARRKGRSLYLRLNRRDGSVEDHEIADHDLWRESGQTDLAVYRCPFSASGDFELERLLPSQLAHDAIVKSKEVGPGDEVFFCGLFSEHYGRKYSQPIVRWGNVSMMPGEKVRVKTPEGGTRLIDAYLVEARSWGGQSGSPAFVFFPANRELGFLSMPSWQGGDPGEGGQLRTEDLPLLLGVVQGHFDIEQDVSFKSEFDDQAHVAINAGIAVVIPAQKIIDLLNEDDLMEDRKQIAEEQAGKRPAATPDAVPDKAERSEFERFEDLTRKLVDVPKEQLDEKRKDES